MKALAYIFLFFVSGAVAQTKDDQYKQATKLRNEGRYDEALAVFQQLLKSDSSKFEYLTHTSWLYSKLGNKQKSEQTRQEYFRKAEYMA